MIANSITGGSASNQLLDLIAVVSNPDVYKEKLASIEAATAENKKYVEAIGPASEIVKLREEAVVDREQAKKILEDASANAELRIYNANIEADTILSNAQKRANEIAIEAQANLLQANQLRQQAENLMADAVAAKSNADTAQAEATAKAEQADALKLQAEAAKADAEATKASIIEKHKAFIESL